MALRFLFLYSNHPSGGMGDLPQRMKEEWEKRHKESAEAAFAAKRLGKPTRALAAFEGLRSHDAHGYKTVPFIISDDFMQDQ